MSRRLVATMCSLLLLLASVPVFVQATPVQACPSGSFWNGSACVPDNPITRFIESIITWIRNYLSSWQSTPTMTTTAASQTQTEVVPYSSWLITQTYGSVTTTVSTYYILPTTTTYQSSTTSLGMPSVVTSEVQLCTHGLGPDSYDGLLLLNINGPVPPYYLALTCYANHLVPISFAQYSGPFTPSDHIGWRLVGVRGYWADSGGQQVFFVTSVDSWA